MKLFREELCTSLRIFEEAHTLLSGGVDSSAHAYNGVRNQAAPDKLLILSQIFKEAQTLLPGGVNSPVRAFKSVGGQPIIFEHVEGPYCFDVDGNKVRAHLCSNSIPPAAPLTPSSLVLCKTSILVPCAASMLR